MLALIVLAILGWCAYTRKFVYAIGGVSIVMCATFLTIRQDILVSTFSKPRHIDDLTDHQAKYFKTVIITMLSVFFGLTADYIAFQLQSSALTWFEVFGIIGGSLSILIKFTRGIGAIVLYCIPKQENPAPFPIGIPGLYV